ncbi:hypothetical protein F5Y15DRAFT_409069 [Xylariaceae sp. FL0016]|nr:hypothetical protein F5Y15DRAFT_409069 [Xylariaceae sp. FL0016]
MAPTDRGPELAVTTTTLLGVSSLTVFLRCYVRIFLLKTFRVEDWLSLGTLTCFITYSTFVMLSIDYGAGKHINAVHAKDIPDALKMRWAGELCYVVTSLFLKFAVGIFLLRISGKAWQKATIWVVLIICLVFNLFYTFVAAFQCQPVEYFWKKYTHEIDGECLAENVILGSTYAAAGINACADWILGLLPIALTWNLDLPKRQRLSVAGILALGIIASAATIVRIPYIWQLAHDEDVLYEFTDLAMWSTVELGLGLTASSIATLRPLFKTFFGGTQNRHSTQWPSNNRGSETLKFHCRGPSDGSMYYRMEDFSKSRSDRSSRSSRGSAGAQFWNRPIDIGEPSSPHNTYNPYRPQEQPIRLPPRPQSPQSPEGGDAPEAGRIYPKHSGGGSWQGRFRTGDYPPRDYSFRDSV